MDKYLYYTFRFLKDKAEKSRKIEMKKFILQWIRSMYVMYFGRDNHLFLRLQSTGKK